MPLSPSTEHASTIKQLALVISAFGLGICPIIAQERLYYEQNGYVMMEAENTDSPLNSNVNHPWIFEDDTVVQYARLSSLDDADSAIWFSSNQYSGSGFLRFNGNEVTNGNARSPIKYKFKINTPGIYTLQLRAAKQPVPVAVGSEHDSDNDGKREDVSNDAYIKMSGDFDATGLAGDATKSILTSNSKLFGGGELNFQWTNEGGSIDINHEKWDATYLFKAGETYELTISGRSKEFRFDRIILWHHSLTSSEKSNARNSRIESPSVPAGFSTAVDSFTLIDSDTDQPVPGYDPIPDGAEINTVTLGLSNINIRANAVPVSGDFGSVNFSLSGPETENVTDNEPVWSLFGDSNGDFQGQSLPDGAYTLTGTPYDADNAGGVVGSPAQIQFTIENNIAPVVAFTEPVAPFTSFIQGYSGGIRVLAAASDANDPIDNVSLYIGGVLVREDTEAPYEWGFWDDTDPALQDLLPGTYELKLVATDEYGYTAEATREITVTEAPADRNIALGRGDYATQISKNGGQTATTFAASGVDGDLAVYIETRNEYDGWWMVDLGAPYVIESINLYGRAGNKALSKYFVQGLNTEGEFVWSTYQAGSAGEPTSLDTGYIIARYIRVQMNLPVPVPPEDYKAKKLSFNEIEVIAYVPPPNPEKNLALLATATQSSDNSVDETADQAIDGDTNTVSKTAELTGSTWWEVDLGAHFEIGDIVLYRESGASELQPNYTVLAKNDADATVWSSVQTDSMGLPTTLNAGGALARYIRVERSALENETYKNLDLAELEVYAQPRAAQLSFDAYLEGQDLTFDDHTDMGMPLGIKYAFASDIDHDPLDRSILPQASMVEVAGADMIEFKFRKRRDALNRSLFYIIEYTDSLKTPVWVTDEVIEVGAATIDSDFEEVTTRISMSENPKRFVRLRVAYKP